MPITRIPYPNPLPTNQQDFVRQNNLLQAGFYRVNEPCAIDGGNITQGAVFQCGGVIYYADADTAIGGVASNYVQLAPNGDGSQLIPTYVANLAGVSWNTAYNGYYDGSGNLYVFNEALALLNGALPAGVLEQRYAEQERTGDLPVGRDVKPNRNVDFTENGVDGDHEIVLASDYSLFWDESEDGFRNIKSFKAGEGAADVQLKQLVTGAAGQSAAFNIKKPISCRMTTSVLPAGGGATIQIQANIGWANIFSGPAAGGGSYGHSLATSGTDSYFLLNPGTYRINNNAAGTTTLYALGVYGDIIIQANTIVT